MFSSRMSNLCSSGLQGVTKNCLGPFIKYIIVYVYVCLCVSNFLFWIVWPPCGATLLALQSLVWSMGHRLNAPGLEITCKNSKCYIEKHRWTWSSPGFSLPRYGVLKLYQCICLKNYEHQIKTKRTCERTFDEFLVHSKTFNWKDEGILV